MCGTLVYSNLGCISIACERCRSVVSDMSAANIECMQALRQHRSSREASLERQLQAAQSHAASIEAAQAHRTQEQFVDDCLKVQSMLAQRCFLDYMCFEQGEC